MRKTRLELGKLWFEYFEKEKVNPRQDGITKDHPYILEYLKSIEVKEEPKEEVKPKPKKKGKKVK